jgi:hypothetical protein
LNLWRLFERGEASNHTTISTKAFSERMWRSLSINVALMLDIITTPVTVVKKYNTTIYRTGILEDNQGSHRGFKC